MIWIWICPPAEFCLVGEKYESIMFSSPAIAFPFFLPLPLLCLCLDWPYFLSIASLFSFVFFAFFAFASMYQKVLGSSLSPVRHSLSISLVSEFCMKSDSEDREVNGSWDVTPTSRTSN